MMVWPMTQLVHNNRKIQREKLVKENSSKFVEKFSKDCFDKGVTNFGIQIFTKSKQYEENYDKIDWSK